jgi:hypothetical protein
MAHIFAYADMHRRANIDFNICRLPGEFTGDLSYLAEEE